MGQCFQPPPNSRVLLRALSLPGEDFRTEFPRSEPAGEPVTGQGTVTRSAAAGDLSPRTNGHLALGREGVRW